MPRFARFLVYSNSVSGEINFYEGNPTVLNDGDIASYILARTRWENIPGKGVAGGFCGLPNPLDPTLPLRADGTPARPVGIFYEAEFLQSGTTACPPWLGAPISGGSVSVAGSANHPGFGQISSVAAAGSGYRYIITSNMILIAGGELCSFCFRPQTLAGTIVRLGYHDAGTSVDANNGCYIEMAQVAGVDGVIVGKTAAAAARSTTATNFTLITNTWYNLRVAVNAAANLVTFSCFSEAGALLWSDTLNANIPTAVGQECGHGIVATRTGGATFIANIDYMSLEIARALVR